MYCVITFSNVETRLIAYNSAFCIFQKLTNDQYYESQLRLFAKRYATVWVRLNTRMQKETGCAKLLG